MVLRGNQHLDGWSELLKPVDRTAAKRQAAVRAGNNANTVDIEAIIAEARAEGHAQGYELGVSEGRIHGTAIGQAEAHQACEAAHRGEFESFRKNLDQIAKALEGSVSGWYDQAEDRIATLALELAARALRANPEAASLGISELVREVLAEVRHGADVRIRVNPFAVADLQNRREEILNAISGIRSIEIVADASLQGGCIIEGEGGIIDARLETYLSRLAANMQEAA